MFFIGIFGIDRKSIKVRNLVETQCRECRNSAMSLYKDFYRFHFFFITIFTWGKVYRIVCENCGAVYRVEGEKESYSYWDLKNTEFKQSRQGGGENQGIFSGSPSGHDDSFKGRCSECGAELDSSWDYCPSCGKKL